MSFAGIEGKGGSLFGVPYPSWVNRDQSAGHTAQVLPKSVGAVVWPVVTLQSFLLSPNFVWFAISVAMYLGCPYDLESAKVWAWDWVLVRVALNLAVTFGYYGYWHVTLYVQRRSSRKYNTASAGPSPTRLFHNMWYALLGALQWVAWECAFMHLWATGRLPFTPDTEVLLSWKSIALFALHTLLVPIVRELHFYWAHRLLHLRVLYKHVHSLHHRNVDPDPFSGICMHPVEHLYYYATVWPSIIIPLFAPCLGLLSPFHLLWNGMHAVISPAAGHSGWEDHWQSDQFHYLHHAKFECNYGGGGLPFDAVFGTFSDKVEAKKGVPDARSEIDDVTPARGRSKSTAATKGGSTSKRSGSARKSTPAAVAANPTKKASSGSAPPEEQEETEQAESFFSLKNLKSALPTSLESALYFLGTAALAGLACYTVVLSGTGDARVEALRHAKVGPFSSVALAIAFGPVVMGFVLSAIFGDSMPMLWPFHKKESLVGALGIHLLLGVGFTSVPVYVLVETLMM